MSTGVAVGASPGEAKVSGSAVKEFMAGVAVFSGALAWSTPGRVEISGWKVRKDAGCAAATCTMVTVTMVAGEGTDDPVGSARRLAIFLDRLGAECAGTEHLLSRGYEVVPVNPMLAGRAIHGCPVVASLADATPLEMVDIFRASANAGAAVDEAIRLKARVVWMQLGVVDEAAAERARAAGITVVMDRCPVIEERRLGLARH